MINTQDCLIKVSHPEVDFKRWQQVVNILAELYDAASGTIVQFRQNEFNVVSTSKNKSNFLEVNSCWPYEIQSFCREMMETRSFLYVNDALDSKKWRHAPPVSEGPVRSYLGFPIFWPDQSLFGSICIIDIKPTQYPDILVHLLSQFKEIIESDLKHLVNYEKISALALTDELTQLYNRRGFETLASQRIKDAIRFEKKLAFIYFDINNLKFANDNLGHEIGDLLIKEFANTLKMHTRDSDIKARLGGDEFIVMILSNSESFIDEWSQDIVQSFNNFCNKVSTDAGLGVSYGAAVFKYDSQYTLQEMISIADKKMYVHKKKSK
jgi:diguanylate cyclase (GGDEF)-like protein